MTLENFVTLCSYGILTVALPFLTAQWGRRSAVRGSEQWHRYNLIVTTLRPLVKPAAVLYTATSIIRLTVLSDWRWYTLLLIGFDLIILQFYWKWAEDDRDDDEGGPWNKVRDALRRLSPGRTLAPSGA